MTVSLLNRVRNIVTKGEIAGNDHFLLLPQYWFAANASKCIYMLERVTRITFILYTSTCLSPVSNTTLLLYCIAKFSIPNKDSIIYLFIIIAISAKHGIDMPAVLDPHF